MADKLFTVSANVSARDLSFAMEHDDIFDLIVALDDQVAEMEFTEKLRDHFIAVCEKEYAAGEPREQP